MIEPARSLGCCCCCSAFDWHIALFRWLFISASVVDPDIAATVRPLTIASLDATVLNRDMLYMLLFRIVFLYFLKVNKQKHKKSSQKSKFVKMESLRLENNFFSITKKDFLKKNGISFFVFFFFDKS